MHAGRNYTLREVTLWTRRETFVFFLIAGPPTAAYALLDWKWLGLPWLPIALLGTAVAFITGFKNNASYDRAWEARKVWGAIVNSSRIWGSMVIDFVTNLHAQAPVADQVLEDKRRRLVHRHIAWLAALRFQLRQPRVWETQEHKANVEYRQKFEVAEEVGELGDELLDLLAETDCQHVRGKANTATQILATQSHELRELRLAGLIDDFRHMELQKVLSDLYVHQGKCERIKNFPYPRQFATLNLIFVWLFILLAPFGLLPEFAELGKHGEWLTIPFSMLVSWIFHTIDKIGSASENPFEGGANDTPITALSRTIEIDLREMLGEQNVPKPLGPVNHILM
ncbi:MAG: bestrophin family ion channel [Myxococcales bacterium]|nr:bestrophin family ion channel [Myxococcales bacterium]MDD9970731.1 bestrophin family ion channel [Myxococcales bacterium]